MKQTVLYIGGAGRSGSTLIDLILGNITGAVSVGEVKHFFEYYCENKVRCGCGVKMQECPFWGNVVKQAGFSLEEITNIAHTNVINRTRNYFNKNTSVMNQEMILAHSFARLYAAVGVVSGKEILVDSSKSPMQLKILKYTEVDLRVLHLVRHPLAVAYSWSQRDKTDPADGSKMAKRGVLASLMRWGVENIAVSHASRSLPRTIMDFDEFVNQPNIVLDDALNMLNMQRIVDESKNILDAKTSISATHSVGGNPIRFSAFQGLKIRKSDEWKAYYPRYIYSVVTWLFNGVMRKTNGKD